MPIHLLNDMPGGGDAADRLAANDWDINALRPFIWRDGRSYITRMVYNERTGQVETKFFLTNAPAALPYDSWKVFDDVVIRALQDRLRAFADVRGMGLTYNIPGGLGATILQYNTMSKAGRATVSMDPTRRSEADRPEVDQATFPLPVVYSDFDLNMREIEASRRGFMRLDTTMASESSMRVAEELEMMLIGANGTTTITPYAWGGGTVYGYVTAPFRSTKTDMTVPTGSNGAAVLADFLALRQMLIDDKHYGPYMVYVNSQWSQFLDTDFSADKGDNTLRQRILSNPDFQDIRVLDYLPKTQFHVVIVEMRERTVRILNTVEVQLVQWDSMGGLKKHFKVMCSLTPQLRADQEGTSGIAHGRTA